MWRFSRERFRIWQVVEALLAHASTEVNRPCVQGATSLFIAAAAGHAEVVEALLSATGIDPNLATPEGLTPLAAAAGYGRDAVIQQLVGCARSEPKYGCGHAAACGMRGVCTPHVSKPI